MNRIKLLIKVTFPIAVMASIVGFKMFFNQQNSHENLLGKYVSTEDPNWVWEFKSDGKLYDYYEGELSDVYYYSIENTSPQCGFEVDEGPLFKYFIRTHINNPSEKFCYEIYGLQDGFLQLRYFGTNSIINFKKNKLKYI